MNTTLQEKIEEAARQYNYKNRTPYALNGHTFGAFIEGAKWMLSNLWKDAEGEDLPEINKEVLALQKHILNEEDEEDCFYQVVFAHRVDIDYVVSYDKGEWNIPNIKWWLDLELPIKE